MLDYNRSENIDEDYTEKVENFVESNLDYLPYYERRLFNRIKDFEQYLS